ncbi:hypothetical protein BDV09DRAFT_167666 [Aspergillus tetrazonus]
MLGPPGKLLSAIVRSDPPTLRTTMRPLYGEEMFPPPRPRPPTTQLCSQFYYAIVLSPVASIYLTPRWRLSACKG